MQGIVESDETFFRESLTGRREITDRKAKKRGEKDKKIGISNLKIDTVIGDYIHPSALLCTDTATNYKKFAKLKGLLHETVNELKNNGWRKG